MILINPRSTKFGIFEKYVPLSVPIGLGYLAGYLLHRKKQVKILDEHIAPVTIEALQEAVQSCSPPYIFGISSLTACIYRSFQITAMIKKVFPEAKIILGGIHPTVLPEEVLKNRDIDFIVRGEGEFVLDELYDAIKNSLDYTGIQGLSYVALDKIVHNPCPDLPDLTKLPPFPYHLFEGHADRYSLGFIASSRGCPYECIFCSQRSISGHKFRYVPTDFVIQEIDLLINKYGQTHINFVDDNFTANKVRIKELCDKMIAQKFFEKATFDCQTRADAINDEILTLLKEAGFRLINFGLETASERLMVILNKRETVQQNIEAVKLAKKHGFGVSGTFIFGLPTETREERWRGYNLAKELNLDYVRFNNATPYPGTKLYEIAKQENRLYVDENWSNLNACASLVRDSVTTSRLPYVPVGCDEETLRKDIVRANLFFSLRPSRVLRLLAKRVGPAGWFYLPPRWYLKPKEWLDLIRLALNLLGSFIRLYK